MANKKSVLTTGPLVVKVKKPHDFDGLYQMMQNFFTSRDFDLFEKKYKDKGVGDEIEGKWVAEREIDEYMKWEIKVEFKMWDVQFTEVKNPAGETVKGYDSRLRIIIDAFIVMDYNNMFSGSGFKEWMGKTYFRMKERDIDFEYTEPLINLVQKFQQRIKKYLGFETKKNA